MCRFGLNSMISEVIREDEHSNSSANCDDSSKSNNSDDDFDKKSDNAIDYSDINELAEDVQVLMQEVTDYIGYPMMYSTGKFVLLSSLPKKSPLKMTRITMTLKIPFLLTRCPTMSNFPIRSRKKIITLKSTVRVRVAIV